MDRIERSLQALRREQAKRVMPKVGAMLDAWDNTSNDEKGLLREQFPHLCALIEDIAQTLAARQDGAWQDIATAPKDNSAVLVFCPTGPSSTFIATAFWDTVAHEWRIAWTGIGNPPVKAGEPTHWQPLPEPPAS